MLVWFQRLSCCTVPISICRLSVGPGHSCGAHAAPAACAAAEGYFMAVKLASGLPTSQAAATSLLRAGPQTLHCFAA